MNRKVQMPAAGVLFLVSGMLDYATALTAMTDWTQGHGASLRAVKGYNISCRSEHSIFSYSWMNLSLRLHACVYLLPFMPCGSVHDVCVVTAQRAFMVASRMA